MLEFFKRLFFPSFKTPRHYWRAYGYHGKGNMITPGVMSEAEAVDWVSKFGPVMFVDRESGFIFYRPKE